MPRTSPPGRQKILVVEDDPKIRASIRLYLEHGGYDVVEAASGPAALKTARASAPDLLVLDLMIPGLDGLAVCRALRRESATPILMLTARAGLEDKLTGLDAGADDYLTKPFSPRELVARVRAVLRRSAGEVAGGPAEARSGSLVVSFERREVTVRGSRVALTPAEFNLLAILIRSPGRVFTRAQLAERAFGGRYEAMDRTVDAHVMNLRRKIEPDRERPSLILTVFGVGYRLAGKNDAP
jgi:DNA-binding response OmpR family regulator